MIYNMYAIKWTRRTGETGVYRGLYYKTLEDAKRGVAAVTRIDQAKRMLNEYKYEIVEIG